MKTFFTLVATGLLVVLVIQMAVEFRPEHMCVIRGLVVFLGGTFVFVVSVSGAMAGYYEEREDGWHSISFRFFLFACPASRIILVFVFLPLVAMAFINGYVIGGCLSGLAWCFVFYVIELYYRNAKRVSKMRSEK
ncbi:MAG TPA: hypothetical protein PL000_21965 [Anaerolineales bacterium]|nr:hypothetical protein [Anaerolineales bacterium]